ncbi:hypothetical protein N9Y68_06335 [Luminiphilus sp.]|nr:hypothetical protein [Luminiphilus sp.]
MNEDCAVCKTIRLYLLFAVPLLAYIGLSSGAGDESPRLWITQIDLIALLSWGALAALILVVCYRFFQEYILPKRRLKKLESLKSEQVSGNQ